MSAKGDFDSPDITVRIKLLSRDYKYCMIPS